MLVAGELSDDIGVAGRDNLYGYGLINAQRAVAAALAATGASPDTSAGLEASSSVLNFGNELEQLDLVLANRGQGELRLLELSSASPWLQLTAADTDADGLGRYTVSVDRSALAPGVYGADIIARSTRNTLVIKVLVSVGDTGRSDLGVVYLLLYDPATDEVVEQLALRANAGRYPFQLPPVSEGSYQLYAGTDADNDLFICDAGEACGAWLTVDQPALLELNRDLDGLEFPVEYQVALPDIESLASPADDRPVLPLRRAP